MPLIKKPSKKAFSKNVKAEMEAGKPQKQAVAIAYSVKREAEKKHSAGGVIEALDDAHLKEGEYSVAEFMREKRRQFAKNPKLNHEDVLAYEPEMEDEEEMHMEEEPEMEKEELHEEDKERELIKKVLSRKR